MTPLLLYTMTSGLGDFIIMGDVMRKVEALIPGSKCLIAHRGNPHVKLWTYDDYSRRFFDIYNPLQIHKLISTLKSARERGFTAFGLQMAPGSLQGFLFHTLLKKMKALNYIVDFNLINADIITPPKDDYILNLHLNQIKYLMNINIPEEFYRLEIPIRDISQNGDRDVNKRFKIGIHPWSRRNYFPCFEWPRDKWATVMKFLLANRDNEIVIFGKDKRFEELRCFIQKELQASLSQILFSPCDSVEQLIAVIQELDLLLSVNTSVVHIGHALNKKMVILCGPSLDIWVPKGNDVIAIKDDQARLPAADRYLKGPDFPTAARIIEGKVLDAIKLLNKR
jgi:ADP-heptose:LPS heptosyltransferase